MPEPGHLKNSKNLPPLVASVVVVDSVNPAKGLPLAMTASNAP
jgi:hypothetical protein